MSKYPVKRAMKAFDCTCTNILRSPESAAESGTGVSSSRKPWSTRSPR
jgi:hypothetical protein